MIDTHLAVGRWRLRGGHPDPLCWRNGGLFRGPLVVHLEVLFLLSAVATEVLSQAADAHDGQDDQEDDDEDPGVRNHQHHPDSPGYPHCTSRPPLTHTHPQGRKPSPVLCGPGPSEGCAQRNWPWTHLKGPEKSSYSWQQLSPQHLNPSGQVLGWGQIEAIGTKVGRQKDPSLPKMHPYTQSTSHTPSGGRVGDSRFNGRNLGPGSEPDFRTHLSTLLCT